MVTEQLKTLARSIATGDIVPYLGPGALAGVRDPANGEAIPADSDSLILALNNGKPMSARLIC